MGKGYALNIGINRVDPDHYEGWDGVLGGCEADARVMRRLCRDRGFATTDLLTGAATRAGLIAALEGYAATLGDGDTLVVSYAGHGGQVPDATGDEPDRLDETWCLYDGMMLDDELRGLWGKFGAGTRILVVSDSCHSESVTRGALAFANRAEGVRYRPLTPRLAPPAALRHVLERHREFYAEIARAARNPAMPQCPVVLVAACKDDQLSYEDDGQGLFTHALWNICSEQGYARSYPDLVDKIDGKTRHKQNPRLTLTGPVGAGFLAGPIFAA